MIGVSSKGLGHGCIFFFTMKLELLEEQNIEVDYKEFR